jgi:hypothetical protein
MLDAILGELKKLPAVKAFPACAATPIERRHLPACGPTQGI